MMEWLTAMEASKILGITDRQVRRLCKNNVLECARRGLMWFVSAESVERERQRRVGETSANVVGK